MKNFKYNNRRNRHRNGGFERNLLQDVNEKNYNSDYKNGFDIKRKKFNRNNHNTSKLIQKYTDLAREALSSGDKIMSENYLQHADHFFRINEKKEFLNQSAGENQINNSTSETLIQDTENKSKI